MATGIGQQLKGMMQKARHYWAELTDDEATRSRHRQEEQDDAVHQRYGGASAQGGRDADKDAREPRGNSPDRNRSDAGSANPTARANRGEGSRQMQGQQAERQYAQQGGSGTQRTLAEQEAAQAGASAPDTGRGQPARPSAGGQKSH